MIERAIRAKNLREGMIVAFANERFNYRIDEVSMTRDGEIKVEHGDFTATDFFDANDLVYVRVDN